MFNAIMNFGFALILLPIAIVLIWAGVSLGSMKKKFVRLGTLRGMTYGQIVSAVGKGANAIQHMPDGSVRVWQSLDYQITLLFDANEVCLGVSNETAIL
jgi:hypothetical protein